MEPTFNIVFTGQFTAGMARDTVLREFASRFNLSEEKAAAMLPENGTTILKRNVDEATATKFQQFLNGIGVIVELQEVEAGMSGSDDSAAVPDAQGQEASSDAEFAGQSFNPYEKVSSRRDDTAGEGDSGNSDDVDGEILRQKVFEGAISVPASRGVKWITEAYSNHVHKDMGAWIGAVVIYLVLSVVLSIIPLIGSIALIFLGPIVTAGFMIGAREQTEGGSFSISHLFSAFDQSPGQLILVAVFYYVGIFVAALVAFAFFGMPMLSALNPDSSTPPDLAVLSSVVLPVLVMLLLILPLMMAYWFAPALVVLEGLSALEAMKQSFSGCLKNVLPMLVYGLLALALMFLAAIPLMLGFLLLLPVLWASMFVAYKDIYRASETVFQP